MIELLIVVAIIAILALIIFVALNPLKRFRDSRDSVRLAEATELALAIKLNQVDNGGTYFSQVENAYTDVIYMISFATTTSSCDDLNAYCDTDVGGDDFCLNLYPLVSLGYLGELPVSPKGVATWTDTYTGYTLEKETNDAITIRACESEDREEIKIIR